MTTRPKPKNPRPPHPLTREEFQRLLAAPDAMTLTGKRARALMAVGHDAGLRCAEALALNETDVDMQAGTIRILCGKGGKSRIVGLTAEALAVLKDWAGAKHAEGWDTPWLFCNAEGRAKGQPPDIGKGKDSSSARMVRAMMTAYGQKAGITKPVRFHGLRHTFAFELADEGKAPHVIRDALGHSNLSTTDNYIRKLNPKEVIEAMQARSWGDPATAARTPEVKPPEDDAALRAALEAREREMEALHRAGDRLEAAVSALMQRVLGYGG